MRKSIYRGRIVDLGLETVTLPSGVTVELEIICLLYTSPSPRDRYGSRMPSSA